MRIILQPAFILHRRWYRETSLLLEVLTEDHGRVSLIAKGVRRNHSPWRALLQPFFPLLLSFQGKTELLTLTQVEAESVTPPLEGECLLAAFYLNELLMYLLHKFDPHPKLYTIYQNTLLELQTRPLQQKTLRLFEKRLLEELGYGLQWQQPFDETAYYRYESEFGFRESIENQEDIMVFSGRTLIGFVKETW